VASHCETATTVMHRDGGARVMPTNHYMSVAVEYLFLGTEGMGVPMAAVGKTWLSSAMIDSRGADWASSPCKKSLDSRWVRAGLLDGKTRIRGEASAGGIVHRSTAAVENRKGGIAAQRCCRRRSMHGACSEPGPGYRALARTPAVCGESRGCAGDASSKRT